MANLGEIGDVVRRAPVRTRRLAGAGALLLVVAGGLAVAASPGQPQVGDPGVWLAVVAVVVVTVALVWAGAALLWKHDADRAVSVGNQRNRAASALTLLVMVAVGGSLWAIYSLLYDGKPAPPPHVDAHRPSLPIPQPPRPKGGSASGFDVGPYLVLLIAVVVLAAVIWGTVHFVGSRRRVEAATLVAGDPLVAAVEAALLDLDDEQDPRRAVIKAYARTESVLRAHGLPRRPAETPMEYLDRVLRELGAQAEDVDRLTELYERAAFSTHTIDPQMREEAIGVFLALRAGLLAEPRVTP